MFIDWAKENKKLIAEKLLGFIKAKWKKVAMKLAPKLLIAIIPSLFTGPFFPIAAACITIGLILFDGASAAWDEYKKGGSAWEIFKAYNAGVWDSVTLGLFGVDSMRKVADAVLSTDWIIGLGKKIGEGIQQFTNFLEEKITIFSDFIIEKFKKIFTANSSPEKYNSAVEEYNKKRIEEEMNERKKYEEYFNGMYERIQKKRNYIKDLQTEIALLEDERNNE